VRTLFINRLEITDDQNALYEWFVKHGHTPEDVLVVCKPGTRGSNHALVRFANEGEALHAQEQLNGAMYNHPTRGVQIMLSRCELEPPTDPRWDGLWLNWKRNVGRENTGSRGDVHKQFRMSRERLTTRRKELGY
jgi:hypothetical protein